MKEHPITPPSEELVDEWEFECAPEVDTAMYIATQASRWGADQELYACCEWLAKEFPRERAVLQALRNARRPKPPSLKERALQALYRFNDTEGHEGLTQEQIAEDFVIIRRALESLPTCQHLYHA